MNWAETAIIEISKIVRYALRSTGTTLRLCGILAALTGSIAVMAWLNVL